MDLEKQIESVQRSTRTLIGLFVPIHNWIRLKSKWYYKWHLKSYSSGLHWVVLVIYLLSIPLYVFNYYNPKNAQLSKADTPEVTYDFPRWQWANPRSTGNTIRAVTTCSDSTIWAVGDSGTIIKSVDNGASFTQEYTNISERLNAIACFSPSNIVAVGSSGMLLQYNGFSWTRRDSDLTSNWLSSVTVTPSGQFIAVGNSGTILLSSDGSSWSLVQSSGANLTNVIFSVFHNLYLATSNNNTILYSSDGESWSTISVSTLRMVAVSSSGNFVGINSSGSINFSTDGINWSQVYSADTINNIISAPNNHFVAVGYNGAIVYSYDDPSFPDDPPGTHWAVAEKPDGLTDQNLNSVISKGNNHFVAVGNDGVIIYSHSDPPGAHWTVADKPEGITSQALNYIVTLDNGNISALGNNGVFIYSSDGENWSKSDVDIISSNLWGVSISSSGQFVGVGSDGLIAHSSNGIDWNIKAHGLTSATLYDVASANDQFVAVGDSSAVVYSYDDPDHPDDPPGSYWALASLPVGMSSQYLNKVASLPNGQYVAVGSNGTVLYSYDDPSYPDDPPGSHWNLASKPTGITDQWYYGITVLDKQDGQFAVVAVGERGAIVYSEDGINWSKKTSGVIEQLDNITTTADGNFVAVGVNGTILFSTNGTSWSRKAEDLTYSSLTSVVSSSEGQLVAVGSDGTIIYSYDDPEFPGDPSGSYWRIAEKPSNLTDQYLYGVSVSSAGQFVVVGLFGTIVTSFDGVNWSGQLSGATTLTPSRIVAASNGRFVVVGQNGIILYYSAPANASANSLMIQLPGQNNFSDDSSGITGVPDSVRAGETTRLKIYATEKYSTDPDRYRLAKGIAYNIGFVTSDPNASNPAPIYLNYDKNVTCDNSVDRDLLNEPCGIGFADVVFYSAGDQTVSARDINDYIDGGEYFNSASIQVLPGPPIDIDLAPYSNRLVAGTPTTSPISFSFKDQYGNDAIADSDMVVSLVSDASAGFSTSASGPWENTLDLTIAEGSGSSSFYYLNYSSGTHTINFSMNNENVATASVIVDAGAVDPLKSSVTLSSSSVIANNSEVNVTASLLDASSNKVSGKEIVLFSSRSEDIVASPSVLTNANGQSTGTIKSTKVGQSTITAYDKTDNIYLPSSSLAFTPGPSEKLILENYPSEIVAGTAFSIKSIMKDKYDNTDTNYAGILTVSSSDEQASLPGPHNFTSSDNGIYSFENIILKTAGVKSISLQSSDGISSSVNITVKTSTYSSEKSSFNLNPSIIKADNKDQAIATIKISDAYSNVLSNKNVKLTSSLSAVNISPASGLTNANGEISFNITSAISGSAVLTAEVEGSEQFLKSNLIITSVAPDVSKSNVSLSAKEIKANGKEYAILNILLKDSQDNPIPREELVISTSRPESDTLLELTDKNLKDLEQELTPLTFFSKSYASTPLSGITTKTDSSGVSKIIMTSDKEGSSTISIVHKSTGTKIAELIITIYPLKPVEKTVEVVKDIISTISNSPIAKKIAMVTEPLITSVAAISALPIIANVFGSIPSVFNFFSYISVSILETLGLKRRRKPWGRVYDAITGKPIDLAVVRIFDEKHKLIETRVTDFEGRFGFLVQKGKYSVSVLKDGFHFPSTIAKNRAAHFNEKYQLSSETYFGQPIAVEENSNINLDIPVDPVLSHMTIFVRVKLIIKYITDWIEILLSYMAQPFLFIGAAISTFNYVVNSNQKNFILLVVYLALFIFLLFKYKALSKSFGLVLDENGKPVKDALVSIYDKEYNTLRQSESVDKFGRFHFLVKPGTYYLSVSAPGYKMIKDEEIISKIKRNKKEKRIYNGSNIAYSKPGYVAVDVIMEKKQ